MHNSFRQSYWRRVLLAGKFSPKIRDQVYATATVNWPVNEILENSVRIKTKRIFKAEAKHLKSAKKQTQTRKPHGKTTWAKVQRRSHGCKEENKITRSSGDHWVITTGWHNANNMNHFLTTARQKRWVTYMSCMANALSCIGCQISPSEPMKGFACRKAK